MTNNLGEALGSAAAIEVGRFMREDTAKCVEGLRDGSHQTAAEADKTRKKVEESTD